MTKPPRDGARPEPVRRPTRDPYGLLPKGVPIAAVLVDRRACWLIGFVTLSLADGNLPFTPNSPAATAGRRRATRSRRGRRPRRTSSSSRPRSPGIEVAGTLVYAKDGNIWTPDRRRRRRS